MAEDAIRSISRVLLILRTMNVAQCSTLRDLHLRTGLAKPTVFRILRTLQREGYVRAEGDAGLYRLTSKVRELSSGYTERSLVVDVGSPLALRLTREIRWPLAIGTLDGDAVVVRYSTMPYSPLAMYATTVGRRLGLLDSAMGRTYLAFCNEAERAALRERLRVASRDATLAGHADHALKEIRRHGYAIRLPDANRSSATLAVPVLHAGNVIAILSMTTFGNSLTTETVARCYPLLQSTARDIAEGFAARDQPFDSEMFSSGCDRSDANASCEAKLLTSTEV